METTTLSKTAAGSESGQLSVRQTTPLITSADRWDHFLARWGVRRSEHRVEPGLYAIGKPGPESPVFVTANYTLSFDALRSVLQNVDGYILVLDTKGVNVWCAAGKGTFGTDELVKRIAVTGLAGLVTHRTLILPQLGAAGVAAHEVKKRAGFKVEFGPVRAADLPRYLESRSATPEMRRVSFSFGERLVLIPVELVHVLWPTLLAAIVLFFVGGLATSIAAVVSVVAGTVLFPLLLPWLPTRDFSSKGLVLGSLAAIPFALHRVLLGSSGAWVITALSALSFFLAMPAVTAFLSLNFTGSTTFTSKTGVKREMATYIPVVAVLFGAGVLIVIGLRVFELLGGTR